MNRLRLTAVAIALPALLAPLALSAQNQSPKKAAAPASTTQAAKKKPADMHNDGERIFEQNCSRCHNAPDGFPPSISGTVVRHMRVRASLSKHDEEELLRFFNP